VDLFITFLSLGKKGLNEYLNLRKENYIYLRAKLTEVATKYGEKVLDLPHNGISIGLSLSCLNQLFDKTEGSKLKDIAFLGAMLYQKRVMGTRVTGFKDKDVCGFKFKNYGAGMDNYGNLPFITAAASMGLTKKEVDIFLDRLVSSFEEIKKIHAKSKKEKIPKEISPDKKEEIKIEEVKGEEGKASKDGKKKKEDKPKKEEKAKKEDKPKKEKVKKEGQPKKEGEKEKKEGNIVEIEKIVQIVEIPIIEQPKESKESDLKQ